MPEIIDKDLLVRTLGFISYKDSSSIAEIGIDIRTSTYKEVLVILRSKGFVNEHDEITAEGSAFLENKIPRTMFNISHTPYGVAYETDTVYMRDLSSILSRRPSPNYEIDHQPLLPELTGMRAHYIASEDVLYDKNVAMVGDYDSTGIALNLVAKIGSMTVFDIDSRLLDYFKDISRERGFTMHCNRQDIFKKPPKELVGTFDIFVTDPPYAMGGMKKFIEFGIALLKDEGIGYIAVPYHDSIPWTERMLYEVNKLAAKHGCVVTDVFKNFHRYQTADGLRSSMVRIKKGSKRKPINQKMMYSYKQSNINVPTVGRDVL